MQDRIDAIMRYLSNTFSERPVEHHVDFDNDAQSFKVRFNQHSALFKISDEIIADNDPETLTQLLEQLRVGRVLEGTVGTKLGALLSRIGLSRFDRM